MTEVGSVQDESWFVHPDDDSNDQDEILLLQKINRKVDQLQKGIDSLMTQSNATQAQIDALTQKVTDNDTAIQTAVAALNAEIATLQGQGVNISGLQAAVDKLTTDVASDQPTPNPAPTPGT